MSYPFKSTTPEENRPPPTPTPSLPPAPPQPQLAPSSQFAQDLHSFVARLRQSSPEDLAQRIKYTAPIALSQTRSFTHQVSLALTHPIETRMGTCTVGSALLHTGAIWTVCCRSNWVAKLGTEWMAFSSAPVRALVFVGLTAHYLNPPVQRWDASWYLQKANRFFKSLG